VVLVIARSKASADGTRTASWNTNDITKDIVIADATIVPGSNAIFTINGKKASGYGSALEIINYE
jgi:hypothetical protein